MAGGAIKNNDIVLSYPYNTNDKSIGITCDYACHLKNSVQAIYPGTDYANGGEFEELAIEDGLAIPGIDPAGALITVLISTDGRREWLYVHMSKQVRFGKVKRGDLLGYAGTTGNSTGNHLHLGLSVDGYHKWQDPDKYIKEHLKPLIINLNDMDSIQYKDKTYVTTIYGDGVRSVILDAGGNTVGQIDYDPQVIDAVKGITSEIIGSAIVQCAVSDRGYLIKRRYVNGGWSDWYDISFKFSN